MLTWSDDGTARLWSIPDEPATSVAERILEPEILTATQLYGSSELRVLTLDEWQAKTRDLNALRAKRQSGY